MDIVQILNSTPRGIDKSDPGHSHYVGYLYFLQFMSVNLSDFRYVTLKKIPFI